MIVELSWVGGNKFFIDCVGVDFFENDFTFFDVDRKRTSVNPGFTKVRVSGIGVDCVYTREDGVWRRKR